MKMLKKSSVKALSKDDSGLYDAAKLVDEAAFYIKNGGFDLNQLEKMLYDAINATPTDNATAERFVNIIHDYIKTVDTFKSGLDGLSEQLFEFSPMIDKFMNNQAAQISLPGFGNTPQTGLSTTQLNAMNVVDEDNRLPAIVEQIDKQGNVKPEDIRGFILKGALTNTAIRIFNQLEDAGIIKADTVSTSQYGPSYTITDLGKFVAETLRRSR